MEVKDRDLLKKRIREMEPWFHCIDLGDGLTTKTKSYWGEALDHPLQLWTMLKDYLPKDFSGKRALDVGCNAGFMSVEAKKRGADYVLGMDVDPHYIEQAKLVASILELDIDFRQMTIHDLDSSLGAFDPVLCLGVVYHLKDPISALERLAGVAEGRLILESAIVSSAALKATEILDKDRRFPPDTGGFVRFVGDPDSGSEHATNWWIPSAKALIAMLRSAGFKTARIVNRSQTRAVVVADR